jgi:hypothetical protein
MATAKTRTWEQIGAIAGIVAVVLGIVSLFLPGSPPSVDASLTTIRAYLTDHRTAVLAAQYIGAISNVLFLLLFGSLWTRIRRAEGQDGPLAPAMLGGGIATTVGALLINLVIMLEAYDPKRDDALVQLLWDMGNLAFAILMFPWALFTLATALSALGYGALPRWLGWSGIVVTAALLLGPIGLGKHSGALAPGGGLTFLGFVLGMLWLLATSVVLLRATPTASVTPRETALSTA